MFKGKKIKLRAYKMEDSERVLKLIEAEGLRETLWRGSLFPLSLEAQKNFISQAISNTSELFHFAIESLEGGELIGGCGINALDRKNSVATVGIWLGKEFQRKGLASDSLRLLCHFIFDELNINKVRLEYFEFNEAGKKCYEAVGFKEEGRHRKEIFRYGKYHDLISMGIFKEELK